MPAVRNDALTHLELWALVGESDRVVGFMGLSVATVEAVFVDPSACGSGGGRALIEYARQLNGPLSVDVNEQNPDAVGFYEALGVRVVGRSETDSAGRPFPLLHMKE